MRIRFAKFQDMATINKIYNFEVESGNALLDNVPRTGAKAVEWFHIHNQTNRPIFVAVDSRDDEKVLGYCALSTFIPKGAYITTTEISVYVQSSMQRKGIGRDLVSTALHYAQNRPDISNMVAIITTSNIKALNLFRGFRFITVGNIDNVAYKLGKWEGVTYMYKLV
ncbi:MAG: N-acetyltransferase family protein [Succinatimonas sp.]|nr:N-acetyltransferase family protein [Succinatimonas sp.]